MAESKRQGWDTFQEYNPSASIEAMDKAAVEIAILSTSTPGLWFTDNFNAERQAAIALAREVNEYGARVVADHKGRYGFFAALPLPDVDASLREIAYALDTLKADGIGLLTSYGDLWLGDPRLRPVFDELNRRGAIVLLPPAAFAPAAAPSDAEVAAWYKAHTADYTLPERRTIRYVTYTDATVKAPPPPSDAEIAARYNENKAKYAPADKRTLSQLVVSTDAAAKELVAAIGAGKTLEAAAQSKGYTVAQLGSLTKDAYTLQSSPDAANAVFSAGGKIVGPIKGPLGWLIVRIDARETTAGKSLEQARPDLVKELTEEKRKLAIAGFGERIEEEINNGATLGDVAKELGLTVSETPPITSNGGIYGQANATLPPELARVVPAAFMMDGSGQPDMGVVVPEKSYVIYDVGTIAPAAPPPLSAIRAQVAEDARIAKGEAAAKAAAEKVKALVEKDMPIDVAVASLGVALPPVDHVDMDRQLLQQQGKNASRPLLMLFAMAKGKVRLMQGGRNHGWYVVTVSEVTPGKVNQQAPEFAGFAKELTNQQGDELGDQLRGGFRSELGSTRNEANLRKLQTQLSGNN